MTRHQTGNLKPLKNLRGPALGHRWNRVAPTTVYEDLAALGYEAAFTISA